MTQTAQGRVYMGVGGFYEVVLDTGARVSCKPRGLLRKQGVKPLAGDRVALTKDDDTYILASVLPRTSVLVRPPVANAEQLLVVASTAQPQTSTLVIDKLCVLALSAGIEPVLVFTKTDLCPAHALAAVYANSGIECMEANAATGQGLAALAARMAGRLSVLCGNSGAGKTTLLNALVPGLARETGPISQKLGRGRHTTREVALFELCGGLLADTPGFASLELSAVAPVLAGNLQLYYPEIKRLIGQCKFSGCTHVSEKGCAVLRAVDDGEISRQRHANYVALYQQAKARESRY